MQLPAHIEISDGLTEMGVPSFRLISDELSRVKELVNEQLTDCSRSVGQLVKELNTLGGKMIRPALVLLSYQAVRDVSCKKKTQYDMRDRQDEAIRVAAIVEIIHNATLLHDDVIDEGQRRRGLPTVNSLRGNESAVLLGDFLLSKASKMRADLEPQINKIIAATTMRVCEGELRQIIQRQNRQLSESEYIDIITEKSASFFSSCCYLGGHLAEASETEVQMLADFGLNVGIAFQITDDLLDIVGDESKTGKTSGSDVDKNKLTLAVIHLLRTAGEREKTAVINSYLVNREAYFEKKNMRYDKAALAAMLKRYGSLEYAHSRAQQFAAKAIEALAGLKESDAKNALIETAGFITGRAV
jgi:octaprenyl-diphosphate synthase